MTAHMTALQPRMSFIDSIRLLAASLVMLQHIFETRSGFIQSYVIPLAPGVAGVAIFFFISGYVIPMATRQGFEVRSFMVRRIFRIYPLYLTVLAVMFVTGATGLLPKLAFIADAPIRTWVGNVFLVADYIGIRPFVTVSWTLAVEMAWYAVFAVSVVVFGRRAADRLDLLVPLSIAAMAVVSLAIGQRIPLGRPTMIYAAVLGFQCFRYGAGEIDQGRLLRSMVVFAIVTLSANYVSFGVFVHKNLTVTQVIGPWIIATTTFLACVLYRPFREARLLNSGLLPILGAMSYSIYLLHPVGTALALRYLPPMLHVTGAILLTGALSWVAYNFIEKQGIMVGRTMARRLVRSPVALRAA